MHAGTKAAVASLTAGHLECHIDVAARRMRVGTDFLVRFPHEHGEIGLSNALILDVHLHREPKTTVLAHADRCRACYLGRRCVFLLLLGDEIERAAEAGGIACVEQVGVTVPGLPGPPIAFGTERSALTKPSFDSVCPLRPPMAVAVAVKSGLILPIYMPPFRSSILSNRGKQGSCQCAAGHKSMKVKAD
jgi:hypothetical protein